MNIAADKTDITGATLASATRNEDGTLADNGNLTLITDELTITNLYDHNTSKSSGVNLSVGLGWSGDKPETKEREGYASGSTTLGLTNSGHNTEQTTYATLGGGTVQKKDGTAHDIASVNTDLNNTQAITLDQQTGGLDATVTADHRWASSEGRNAMAEDFDDTGILMQEIDNVLPSASNDNQVLAGIGQTLNVLSAMTGGIIPADATEGGLIAQIPILIGQEDMKHVVIGEGNRVYVNGIMNNLENAMQGADNIIGEGDKQIWWNPSRGMLSDLLESGVDLLNGIGLQTGISKQAEKFQMENEGVAFYLHSQAHLIFKEGAASTGAGNTYNSYGAPLPSSVVDSIYNIKDNKGALQKNDGNYVANPQNILNPYTWLMPGHGAENYGASRDKK